MLERRREEQLLVDRRTNIATCHSRDCIKSRSKPLLGNDTAVGLVKQFSPRTSPLQHIGSRSFAFISSISLKTRPRLGIKSASHPIKMKSINNTLFLLAVLGTSALAAPKFGGGLLALDCATSVTITTFSGSTCDNDNQGSTDISGCSKSKCVNSQNAGSYSVSDKPDFAISCSKQTVEFFSDTGCDGSSASSGTWSYGQCLSAPSVHGSAKFSCA